MLDRAMIFGLIAGIGTFIFVLFILLHYSVVLTRLTQENKENAQQLALLRWQMEQLQKTLATGQENPNERQNDQNSRVNRDKPIVLTQGVDVLAQ